MLIRILGLVCCWTVGTGSALYLAMTVKYSRHVTGIARVIEEWFFIVGGGAISVLTVSTLRAILVNG